MNFEFVYRSRIGRWWKWDRKIFASDLW